MNFIQFIAANLIFIAMNLVGAGVMLLCGMIARFMLQDAGNSAVVGFVAGAAGLAAALLSAIYIARLPDLLAKRRT